MKDRLAKLEHIANLRTRGFSISLHGDDLILTAVSGKLDQFEYKATRVLENYKAHEDEDVQEFIEDFQTEFKIKGAKTFLAIPRHVVTTINCDLPLEAQENLEETVQYQLPNLFPGNLDEYEFFPQILGREEQLKVMLVAVRKEVLGQAFALMRKWNLQLMGITLDTLGLANGIAKSDPNAFASKQIAVIAEHPNGVEVMGFREGKLINSLYYEYLGDFNPDQIMRNLEEGFSQVRMDPNDVDIFMLAGRPSEALKALLAELQVPIVEWQDSLGQHVPPEALAGFGLCLTAMLDKVPFELNMLPENLRKRSRQWPLALAAVVVAIFAINFVIGEYRQYSDLKEEYAYLDQRSEQLTERLAEISSLRTDFEKKRSEVAMFSDHQLQNVIVKITYELAQKLPDHTYLTNVQIRDFKRITIQGESSEPNRIERILSGMPELKDVKLNMAITPGRNRDGKSRFSYQAELVPGAFR